LNLRLLLLLLLQLLLRLLLLQGCGPVAALRV
jgi:hypothetical protein